MYICMYTCMCIRMYSNGLKTQAVRGAYNARWVTMAVYIYKSRVNTARWYGGAYTPYALKFSRDETFAVFVDWKP